MEDRDQKVREQAHKIWEDEGRPEGQHEDHWRRAEELHKSAPQEPGKDTENWKEEAQETEDDQAPTWPTVIAPD